jgi:hypothetical protein
MQIELKGIQMDCASTLIIIFLGDELKGASKGSLPVLLFAPSFLIIFICIHHEYTHPMVFFHTIGYHNILFKNSHLPIL